MLILILIDVPYLLNVVFNFEKALKGQNHSSSDSNQLIKMSSTKNFPSPQEFFPAL